MEENLDLRVDLSNLPQILTEHASDVLRWGTALAQAIKESQVAELNLKRVTAKTEIKIRQNPLDYGFPKVTEDLIKALVINQPEVVEATQKSTDAKDVVNATKAIVEALDNRRSSLKLLTELATLGWIGISDIPQATSK